MFKHLTETEGGTEGHTMRKKNRKKAKIEQSNILSVVLM